MFAVSTFFYFPGLVRFKSRLRIKRTGAPTPVIQKMLHGIGKSGDKDLSLTKSCQF